MAASSAFITMGDKPVRVQRASLDACLYVHTYVRMNEYKYACMYVCMYM